MNPCLQPQTSLKDVAVILAALGHEVRLKILAALADKELYLSEIAKKVCISRALAKVHLKILEKAGLVESKLVLDEKKGKALRYYRAVNFKLTLTLENIANNKIYLQLEKKKCCSTS